MPWHEYMKRIRFHCKYLKIAFQESRFIPLAIIGITNGGLVTADIIGKKILPPSEIPILSLWASRFSKPKEDQNWYYFQNEYNNSMTSNLRKVVAEWKDTNVCPLVILVDDHLGTGQTSRQAIQYLESQLHNIKIVFVPLVSRRIKQIRKLVETNFPFNIKDNNGDSIFLVEENDFIEAVYTEYEFLPYLDKEINQSSSGTMSY